MKTIHLYLVIIYLLTGCQVNCHMDNIVENFAATDSVYFSNLFNVDTVKNGLKLKVLVKTTPFEKQRGGIKSIYSVPAKKVTYRIKYYTYDSLKVLYHFFNDTLLYKSDSIIKKENQHLSVSHFYADSIVQEGRGVISMKIDSINSLKVHEVIHDDEIGVIFYDSLDSNFNSIAYYYSGILRKKYANEYKNGLLVKIITKDMSDNIVQVEEIKYSKQDEKIKERKVYKDGLSSIILYTENLKYVYGEFPSSGGDVIYHPWFNDF